MTKLQLAILLFVVFWLAVVTEVVLVVAGGLSSDPSGPLGVRIAFFAILASLPLALALAVWFWLRDPTTPLRKLLLLLASPWIVGSMGLVVGSTISISDEGEPRILVSATEPEASPETKWLDVATPGTGALQAEQLEIRNVPRRSSILRLGEEHIQVSGVLRNRSQRSLTIRGFWAAFISPEGEAVADTSCSVTVLYSRCGFSRTSLDPGYVTDFSVELRGWPSVARNDTAHLFVWYQAVKTR